MATSWYANVLGAYTSGAWSGEIVSCGVRGVGWDAGGIMGPVINDPLEEFSAAPSGDTGTTAHCTVAYGSVGPTAWAKATQNTIAEALWQWATDLKTYQATTFGWREIRVSAVEADGSIVNGASVYTITAPIAGAGTMTSPPQAAVVSSLVTGGRGPRNRGRIYVPNVVTPSTDGLVSAGTKTSVNSATKALHNTINAATVVNMAVVSRTNGTYSSITAVRVGDEIDTQRRRRGARKETYQQLAV